jgi:hypothetical protein
VFIATLITTTSYGSNFGAYQETNGSLIFKWKKYLDSFLGTKQDFISSFLVLSLRSWYLHILSISSTLIFLLLCPFQSTVFLNPYWTGNWGQKILVQEECTPSVS